VLPKEGIVRRSFLAWIVALLPTIIPSCQDYTCENKLEGIKGRLWFNPNPIRFPLSEVTNRDTAVQVTVANIGTEIVSIESVSLIGEPDFFLDQGLTDLFDPSTNQLEFPIGLGGGGEDCDRCGTVGFPIFCRQGAGRPAEGKFVIETSDPTSPTLEVPLLVDPDAVLPETQDYPVGVIPIVKPNPIRFHKRMDVGETQTLEVCLRLEGATSSSLINRLELHGDNFGIQGVYDKEGQPLSLPARNYIIGQDTLKILDNKPISDNRDGGTLQVEFVDDLGDQRTLLVPIMDSW
jgi:hypothetical protein